MEKICHSLRRLKCHPRSVWESVGLHHPTALSPDPLPPRINQRRWDRAGCPRGSDTPRVFLLQILFAGVAAFFPCSPTS